MAANSLASSAQLASSASQLDGVPHHLETSLVFAGSALAQAAGVLLRLPQEIIAQAIVIFARVWVGSEGASLKEHSAKHVSAACLYLAAKLSAHSRLPRAVLNVYAFLDALPPTSLFDDAAALDDPGPKAYYLTEGDYHARRSLMMKLEAIVLRILGFNTHVALPYTLCINYLQAVEAFAQPQGSAVAKRAFAHLNSSLMNPQRLYLTHQPHSLATAAIYLAAREVGLKLPGDEWWEVFDTDREELGFLVVAMISMGGFVEQEKRRWEKSRPPLTVDQLDRELERLGAMDDGE
ncbi:cyclin-like protein [Lineolata rhizophorae]|uniref:Cyclin-like protein n=1 Tax=Lineolata rhizophorae TaxID=578093 RepID=A0A6A6NYP2_9PEZI|nr:cyclin-like protein [Lineolata rhizophorae]